MRIPGTWCLFVWGLATAVIPLGLAASARPVEEARFGGPELAWWIVGASVLPAAVAAARYPRGRSSLGRAMGAGLVTAALYAGATVAVYRFVFPMERHPVDLRVLAALGPALAGALAGHLIRWEPRRPRATTTVAAGFALALAGALLMPGTVQDAAQFSAARPTGPEVSVRDSTTFVLPAPGRYTLLADGTPPADPGCRLTGPGGAQTPAEPLTVQPSEPGYDATPATTTIADVDVAVAGAYTMACASGGDADYRLAAGWAISPVADALLRWPLPVLLLIGALPGLALVARGLPQPRTGRGARADPGSR